VDVAGLPAVDRLTFSSVGDHVLVLGAARALFEAAAGLRPTTRGDLRVRGLSPLDAVRSGEAASAPLDPPLPPGWTVLEYVTWSARLMGQGAGSGVLADEAIEAMELETFRRAKLGSSSYHVRRAAVLAGALATGAKTLLVEDPLAGLSAEVSHSIARRLVAAMSGRRTALFAPRGALGSPVAVAADEAIVIDGPRIALQGAPVEVAGRAGLYVLRVAGDVAGFADAIRARGGTVQMPHDAPEAHRLSVQLGPLATRDLFRLADEAQAVVLELRPLGHAFA